MENVEENCAFGKYRIILGSAFTNWSGVLTTTTITTTTTSSADPPTAHHRSPRDWYTPTSFPSSSPKLAKPAEVVFFFRCSVTPTSARTVWAAQRGMQLGHRVGFDTLYFLADLAALPWGPKCPVCMLVPPNWGWCYGGNNTTSLQAYHTGTTHSRPEYPGGVWSRTSARLGASTQRWPRSPEGGPPGTMYPSHPLLAPAPLLKTARGLQGLCPPRSLVFRHKGLPGSGPAPSFNLG